ncbi:putative AlkP superfamily pyrophosphatase or phosphodiesterase [Catalinimonas alkaloidigena]|uniref:alkaline phosphatase PafA n=1 Tax=Catalinimonas alkaloidigena TaxID=1075417 RepID=UPI002406DDEF|nr:alkaline phosphatase PafA [Catalinimonas alkaloidigena]MDF9800492.1 putative AlkP superfamily pyrophosphatase or phosphodiesterase [Catalinimonas alkaloidigena]
MMLLWALACFSLFTASASPNTDPSERPKLVVGIVVDQMRQEYLLRFYDKFGEDGFKRLMNQGFMARNAHYNYIPTYTGPGHASVYTGTTPATHGIIANDWYSRELKRSVYCAEDTTVLAVGGSESAGQISPRNMLSSTITDQLKMTTQGRSKVIGISIKDRGSALPAGHRADAAYWYDGSTGEMMTSTFYMEELPHWVKQFNKQKLPSKYLSQTWNTLLPIEEYTASSEDESEYEVRFSDDRAAVFPYDLKALNKNAKGYGLLSSTPFGNTLVIDFAKAALEAESLGQGGETDFLAVSFSSTDYIGHAFGAQSIELEDTYLRLDRDLADLLNSLDEQVGEGNYLVFLTADHAVVDVPKLLVDANMPGGYLEISKIGNIIQQKLIQKYGEGKWIEHASSQLLLDHQLIEEKGVDLEEIQDFVADCLMDFKGIKETYTATSMRKFEYTRGQRKLLQMGYNFQRSGDVLFTIEPGFLNSSRMQGTSHGTGYNYDTHVPMLFYGWGIKEGESVQYHRITDIAPTLSMLLNIALPDGADGQPVQELFE